ncbi:MAG: DUF2202 domain-containing protein [Chloroflexi bacterium]|nr:DUF2202 domain-containing protein [Chloroflexota bacterium]MCI0729619.1 DUF2202 domain-containing protein [Chloroflexota bacterium]
MTKSLFKLLTLLLLVFLVACTSESTPVTQTVPTIVPNLSPPAPTVEPTAVSMTLVPATPVSSVTPAASDDVMVVDVDGSTAVNQAELDNALKEIDTAGLSKDEVNSILYMREEEKLAHDVYMVLFEQWGLPIFQNIANSELTHTEAVKTLLIRYGLEDPAVDNAIGDFTNETLQSLYDQLVSQGSQSLTEALIVGATIEDLDIVDLQSSLSQTDKADIILVYENLMKGSRNHLRSFVNTLQRQTGETYQPQYLALAAYEDIINSPIESGQGRGGPPVNNPGNG